MPTDPHVSELLARELSNSLASGVVAVEEEEAREAFEKYVRLTERVEEALYFQGTFLEKIGDTVGAEESYRRGLHSLEAKGIPAGKS